MATIQDIIDYVQDTTYNTNINVLIPMINSLAPQVKVLFEDDCEFEEETSGFATIIDFDTTTIQNKNGVIINFNDTDYEMGYSGGQDPFWYYEDENIKLALWYDTEAEETIIMYDTPDGEAGTYSIEIKETESSGGNLPENIVIFQATVDNDVVTVLDPDTGEELSYGAWGELIYEALEDHKQPFICEHGFMYPVIIYEQSILGYIFDDSGHGFIGFSQSDDQIYQFTLDSDDAVVAEVSYNNGQFSINKTYIEIADTVELLDCPAFIKYGDEIGQAIFENSSLTAETDNYTIVLTSNNALSVTKKSDGDYLYYACNTTNGPTVTGATGNPYGGLTVFSASQNRSKGAILDVEVQVGVGDTITITIPSDWLPANYDFASHQNVYFYDVVDQDYIQLTWDGTNHQFTWTNSRSESAYIYIEGIIQIGSNQNYATQ